MLTNEPRVDAYARALARAIAPGCTVLDIGAGTGIFSLLACQYGAGHVYAVEADDIIAVAQAIVADNGYAERITCLRALSTSVNLPVRADVIVSDLRGILPIFEQHIPAVVDARRRLLASGGRLIPHADTLWVGLVEAPDVYTSYERPWLHNDFGLDMHAAHGFVVNSWAKTHFRPAHLLVEPHGWATLDYATVESPDITGEATWTLDREGTSHGLAVWFDTILFDEIGFSNAPGQPELIYGQAFFPFIKPVALVPGDVVSVNLRADLIGDDYIWQWRSRVHPAGEEQQLKAAFNQSTFYGTPFSTDGLRRQEAGFVPALDSQGKIDAYVLSQMDGHRTLAEIARRVADRFPDKFDSWEAALKRASKLSQKYSR